MSSASVNLMDLDQAGLASFFEAMGERTYRATQVTKWIHQMGVADYAAMTNLSQSLRVRLANATEIVAPRIVTERVAADGTHKWVLAVDGGAQIETVFIPEVARGTLCVSSQAGCPLDCSFCATGKQGFQRNLTTAEIIGQVWVAARALGQRPRTPKRITNVVLMGMGEPLLNFEAVTAAMRLMLDDHAYNLGRRRVTLSTAGFVPGIDRLAVECPVSLAVSLHAPNDELRDRLVPLNRRYPVAQLLAACHRYSRANPHDEITFEYVMLDGINDDPKLAHELVGRLGGLPAKLNLIPYNLILGSQFVRPSQASIDRFRDVLVRANIVTVTRKTRGEDIDAACGQLVGNVAAKSARHRQRAAKIRNEQLIC